MKMGLEKILNPYVVDSLVGFSAGFIQGMRYSKFSKYSDYYDSKELKERNNDRFGNSILLGSILPLFDFFVKKIAVEQARYEFVTGLASSVIGFESGKIIGHILYKNNDKLNKEEQEELTKYLEKIKKSSKGENTFDMLRSTLKCAKFIQNLYHEKPNAKVMHEIEKQTENTFNYVNLYRKIKENLGNPIPTTMVIGMPMHPKAHALILQENKITNLSIYFDHYSIIERDDFSRPQVSAKPNISSRQDMEWNSNIDRVIDIVDSYKRDNSVLVILGGGDESIEEKEKEALVKFTYVYTEYLTTKHLAEKMMFKEKK